MDTTVRLREAFATPKQKRIVISSAYNGVHQPVSNMYFDTHIEELEAVNNYIVSEVKDWNTKISSDKSCRSAAMMIVFQGVRQHSILNISFCSIRCMTHLSSFNCTQRHLLEAASTTDVSSESKYDSKSFWSKTKCLSDPMLEYIAQFVIHMTFLSTSSEN